MNLLSDNRKLERYLIELLAALPSIQAEELRLAANKIANRSFTLQAVYQELRKLEKQGIVVRKAGNYSLRFLSKIYPQSPPIISPRYIPRYILKALQDISSKPSDNPTNLTNYPPAKISR